MAKEETKFKDSKFQEDDIVRVVKTGFEGKVIDVNEETRIVKIQSVKKVGSKKDIMEYKIPGRIAILVSKGQEIKDKFGKNKIHRRYL
jgi:hypothetical protein